MKTEHKKQRFKRVAEKRVQNILDHIRKLSQCSNRRMYEWDDNQLEKIWNAVESELKKCKESYSSNEETQFKL